MSLNDQKTLITGYLTLFKRAGLRILELNWFLVRSVHGLGNVRAMYAWKKVKNVGRAVW